MIFSCCQSFTCGSNKPPILRGRDIKRNGYEWAGLYIIATHNGYKRNAGIVERIDINDFPALKNWFDYGDWNNRPEKETNFERLSKRTDKGDAPYNLRDCTYMDDFSKQKIMWSGVSSHFNYVLVDSGIIINAPANFLTGKNLNYLLAFLNSKLMEWYYRSYATQLGESGIRFYVYDFMKLKIPPTTEMRLRLVENSTDLEKTVYSIYSLTDEEIKLISSSVRS